MEAAALLVAIVSAAFSIIVAASIVAWSIGAWLAHVSAELAPPRAPASEDNRGRRFAPVSAHGLVSRLVRVIVAAWVLVVAAAGCKRQPASRDPAPTTSPAASAASPPAPAAAASSAPLAVTRPTGPGISDWRAADGVKACQTRSKDLDPGLASGLIAMAGRGKELAVAWFYNNRVKGEGLVAFSGYDSQLRPLGQPHGLGKGVLARPTIVPRKEGWLALWFDAEGLVYSRATWAATMPSVEHLRAVTLDVAPHTAIIRGKGGYLLAVAPLAASGDSAQLGLFAFAPEDDGGEAVKALGATHHARRPEHSALVETEAGFLVAWEDGPSGDRGVMLTRFDSTGKELGDGVRLSSPGVAATSPTLADTAGGALAAWTEGGEIVVAALDGVGAPKGAARRVAPGDRPTLVPSSGGAALVFSHKLEGVPPHVAAVHVSEQGAVPTFGVVLSDAKGKVAISEPPAAAALEDDRLAVGFVYADGMRGALKVVAVAGCLVDAPTAQ